jgi:hypothetical protein
MWGDEAKFSKRTPDIPPCQTEHASPDARFSLPGTPSIQKCSHRRSGFYYKPLGFEDVAHLKVVWNLLVPPGGLDCRTLKAKAASPQFTAAKALALGKRPDRHSLFSRRKIIGTRRGTIPRRNDSQYVRSTRRCCQGSVPADRSRNILPRRSINCSSLCAPHSRKNRKKRGSE